MEILVACILWYVIGVASFIYWWTTEYDLTAEYLLGSFIIGIVGPVAFPIGYVIHGKSKINGKSKIFIKKRGS